MDQDIPYSGYPEGLSYGGSLIFGSERLVYDGFFSDKPAPRPSLLTACISASHNNMTEIRHGRVCFRDEDGMFHISGLAR